jgi:hypothetical protein
MGTLPDEHQDRRAQALSINNTGQGHGHGGNRGLNTQHGIDGIETRCEGRQDKTNGK